MTRYNCIAIMDGTVNNGVPTVIAVGSAAQIAAQMTLLQTFIAQVQAGGGPVLNVQFATVTAAAPPVTGAKLGPNGDEYVVIPG